MDYRSIIESQYNRSRWQELLHDIFGSNIQFWAYPQDVPVDGSMAKSALYLGKISLPDDNVIAIYEVDLNDSVVIERNRAGIRNLLCSNWRGMGCAGAFMFCIRQNESVLRFSYVSESFAFADDGTLNKLSTDTKRFTYLLGEGHRSRTAIKQFEELKNSSLFLNDITKAFSVEALSDLFFMEYKKHYEDIIEYVTGKRMVKVSNKWEEHATHQPCDAIMNQFALFPDPEKAVRDYVKKLMGRLVFIQFLQKKGWMGCSAGPLWNDGDREFVQNLFKRSTNKEAFVDELLEPLFDDINTKRPGDLVSSPMVGVNIKIPYLNGGLFERDDYDTTSFPLPARFMENLLDFFASYNFTIDENDPDDAEIGVDPEMLGRIFENLLEDNKDKGAFYTPKEVVQYMCRHSLIEYLLNGVSAANERDAISSFVETHEAASLPAELKVSISHKLKVVRICDPAIGSGAFPMGLLHELFACRRAIEDDDKASAVSIKTDIIQNNIYGVDIEKGAVDIARLRFYLALIVDEPTPHTLPNLDYKIMQGNSLLSTFNGAYVALDDLSNKGHGMAIEMRKVRAELNSLKEEFYHAVGDRKHQLDILIKDSILRLVALRFEYEYESKKSKVDTQQLLFADANDVQQQQQQHDKSTQHTDDKKRICELANDLRKQLNDSSKPLAERSRIDIRLFDYHLMFAELFADDEQAGFDLVIGNPPYIQLQKNGGLLGEMYDGKGFETFEKTGDIYSLFYEKGLSLLKPKAHL
ncbi:MAG: Eco57I restriction-modification methylase domain-containing protein, partial [Marinilabiliaceae bacterium]|nr:Eco57I restriction-modification methylase domain-containing protein [Marinilabiliaceae bacterium]